MINAEEYIKEYTYNCSNAVGGWNDDEFEQVYQPWITPDHAMEAVRLAKNESTKASFINGYEKAIEKACEVLKSYSPCTPHNAEFINGFENDMKDLLAIIKTSLWALK